MPWPVQKTRDTIHLPILVTILQGKIADNKKLEGKLDYEKI